MKPIVITKEIAQDLTKEFLKAIMTLGFDGNADYKVPISKVQKDAVEVKFVDDAYKKMMALVSHFSTEIAWHGLVRRVDKTHFEIYDILVYPQTVSGATVNTDQVEYQKWLMDDELHPDEVFNAIRMQGHSHVNMSTSPSGVDLNNQERMLANLGKDDFYIFLIWNKRDEHTCRVYDMAENVMFDEKDVKFVYDKEDNAGFLAEAEKMLKKEQPKTFGTTSYGDYSSGARTGTAGFKTEYGYFDEHNVYHRYETKEKAPQTPSVNNDVSSDVLVEYYRNHAKELAEDGNDSCYLYGGYNQRIYD